MSDPIPSESTKLAEQLEKTPTFTKEHISYLKDQLEKLGPPPFKADRNLVVAIKERDPDFHDHQTIGYKLRRQWVEEYLDISCSGLTTSSGDQIESRLASNLIYTLLSTAISFGENPELDQVWIKNINLLVATSTEKYNLLKEISTITNTPDIAQAQKQTATEIGLPILPPENPLPPKGLKIIWKTLEAGLQQKIKSKTTPDESR